MTLRNVDIPGKTLRSWLQHLDATDGLCITRPDIDLRYQLSAIAKKFDGQKAVLFPRAGGSDVPVTVGLISNRTRMAEALSTTKEDLLQTFLTAAANPIPFKPIEDPPCQEIIHRSVDISGILPVPTHNEFDGGPYISAGLIIVKNPETGAQNLAIARLQVQEKDRLGAFLLPRHTMAFMNLAESKGEDLHCAIVIGASPIEILASQSIAPINQDELEIAGGLLGEPLSVAKCIGSDLFVPAEAEIILEGRLIANERIAEGPFGEFTQYYGSSTASHVINIDLITHRKNPIYHTIIGGSLEHLTFARLPREADILASIRRHFPNVKDIALSEGGICRYHLNIQMDPRSEGEVKNAILSAFAAHPEIKKVTAVDPDVDIHNPNDVEWAVATRFQAHRDLIVIHNAQGSRLDPSALAGVSSKVGLDATIPVGAGDTQFRRIGIPGEQNISADAFTDRTAALQSIISFI